MKKKIIRSLASLAIAGGILTGALGLQAHANIVSDGCINGNYWFVYDHGDGTYGWGVWGNSGKC